MAWTLKKCQYHKKPTNKQAWEIIEQQTGKERGQLNSTDNPWLDPRIQNQSINQSIYIGHYWDNWGNVNIENIFK